MTDADLRSIAIIVVNYGTADLLATELVRLSRTVPEAPVVVVDNHTSAGEAAQVQEMCREHGWTAVLSATNGGFGAGVNRGVEAVRERFSVEQLLLLDPGARIGAEGVGRLLARVVEEPLALVAPVVVTPDGSLWSAGVDLLLDTGEMRSWHRRGDDRSPRMPWVTGVCLALSTTLWDRTGGFDEEYFMYWEDVDLCRRATDAGARIIVDGEVVCTHDARRGASASTYSYYQARNRLLFAARHLTRSEQRRWRRSSGRARRRTALPGGRRLRRWPSVRGAWAGRRLVRRIRRQAKAAQSSGSSGTG